MSIISQTKELSDRASTLQASQIREIAELGMKQQDVIPLWFGEGAWQTNQLIVDAAINSLKDGNHKYQPNNGSMDLRTEICNYSQDLLGAELTTEQITVTPSGMQGLSLAAQLLTSPGDRVVAVSPGWPNIVEVFRGAGALIHTVSLRPVKGHWQLDMQQLLETLHSNTRAIIINSPNNPTGWVMSADEQKTLLTHCRQHGIWIVTDDVYSRLYRHGPVAPSFLSIADPQDRVISVNSFSKCWSMTGWRLGWMVAPARLESKLGQLTEFNTCCTPGFVQQGGITALKEGEASISELLAKIQEGYQLSAQRLQQFRRVEFVQPDGAFYCFFRLAGLTDSVSVAKEILSRTKVGLAPGVAFGPEGEGYLRLCYAQPLEVLEQAFDRLEPYLSD